MILRSVPVFVVLSLCFLASCGASSATTTSSSTPKAAQTTIPLATSVPSPTPTTDRDPFQVNFLQHYQVIDCPAEPNPTNLCYTLQDDPSTSSLGMHYSQPGSTDSGPPIPALNVVSSGASTSFTLAEKAVVTKRSEYRAMSLARLRAHSTDGDTPCASKNSQGV